MGVHASDICTDTDGANTYTSSLTAIRASTKLFEDILALALRKSKPLTRLALALR